MLPETVEPHSYKTAPLPQCASAWLWASLWTSFPGPWPGQCLVSQATLSTPFFCPCVTVLCTHTYMHMLVFICACYMCPCGSQRITVGVIPQVSSTLKKKLRPVTHQVGCAGWALRPRDLPVSTYPVLGMQACYFVHPLYLGPRDWAQVLVLAQAPSWLSHLLGSLLYF